MTVSSGVIVLAHFANFKLAGDRVVRDTVQSLQSSQFHDSAASSARSFFVSSNHRYQPNSRRRRRRRGRLNGRSSARVNSLSDADLEAELAARRSSRARERERYAKAMRSEKLSVLEGELLRLRSEISRIDPVIPLGGGTPPTSRWEALAPPRGVISNSSQQQPQISTPATPTPSRSPPPPPPPPPRRVEDDEPIDPERQKREKAERQRRREQKRKEREAAKKPLTLAEIIRGAGPDPAKRLKPSGSIKVPDVLVPDEEEEKESVKDLKSQLRKANPVSAEESDAKEQGDKVESEAKAEDSSSNSKTGEAPEKEESKEDRKNINGSGTGDKIATGSDNSERTDTESNSQDENTTAKSGDAQINNEKESSDMKLNGSSSKISTEDDNKKSASKEVSSDSNLAGDGANIMRADSNEDKSSGESEKNTKPNDEVKSPADAIAAVSNLMANLPVKKAASASTTGRKPKKLSLAEKRAMRKASAVPAATSNDSRSRSTDNKLDPVNLDTAGNDLKLD